MATTAKLLEDNWNAVTRQAEQETKAPNAAMVEDAFLSIENVQAALTRVCDLHKAGAPALAPAPARAAGGPQAPLQMPRMVPPPEGTCFKSKKFITLQGSWPERYIKIKGNNKKLNSGEPDMGLYVYDDASCKVVRGSTIENLRGCELVKKFPERFTFAVRRASFFVPSCTKCNIVDTYGRGYRATATGWISLIRPLVSSLKRTTSSPFKTRTSGTLSPTRSRTSPQVARGIRLRR